MGKIPVFIVITKKIVLIVGKNRSDGIDLINFIFFAIYPAFIDIVIEVLILDFFTAFQRLCNDSDSTENILIRTFDGIKCHDILLDRLRLTTARKFRDLIDEMFCLFFGDKGSGLYGVHQNLDLRHTELAALHKVFIRLSAIAMNLITAFVEGLDIGIQGTAITLDIDLF